MLIPGLVPCKNSTDIYRYDLRMSKAIIEIKILNAFIQCSFTGILLCNLHPAMLGSKKHKWEAEKGYTT